MNKPHITIKTEYTHILTKTGKHVSTIVLRSYYNGESPVGAIIKGDESAALDQNIYHGKLMLIN